MEKGVGRACLEGVIILCLKKKLCRCTHANLLNLDYHLLLDDTPIYLRRARAP